MEEMLHQFIVVYPVIYKVFESQVVIAGFLPSAGCLYVQQKNEGTTSKLQVRSPQQPSDRRNTKRSSHKIPK